MGLYVSHDAFHYSYGTFSEWRLILAKAAGYRTAKFSFNNDPSSIREEVLVDWGHLSPKNIFGEWDEAPEDSLLILIVHSDCDGFINRQDLPALIERLKALLPRIKKTAISHGCDEMSASKYEDITEDFIQGAEKACAEGENLDFM